MRVALGTPGAGRRQRDPSVYDWLSKGALKRSAEELAREVPKRSSEELPRTAPLRSSPEKLSSAALKNSAKKFNREAQWWSSTGKLPRGALAKELDRGAQQRSFATEGSAKERGDRGIQSEFFIAR